MDGRPTLLMAAHGTRSKSGISTVTALAALVRSSRPGLDVRLAFLDVAVPTLADELAATSGPVVIVPVLLSTGYHVRHDIPEIVGGRPDVQVARHLGPHRSVSRVLAERLAMARSAEPRADATVGRVETARPVALVATGSSDADAAAELDLAAADLAAVIGDPVIALTVGAPLADYDVVPYLLAEGHFADVLAGAAGGVCAAPIGAHPLIAELVVLRFDEAASAAGSFTR